MKRFAYENWYVDKNGYAHDDEGNRWYVGLEEGYYRPGSIPSEDVGGYSRPPVHHAPTVPAQSPQLKAFDALLAKRPNDTFLKSLRHQLASGRALSDPQKKALRRNFHQYRMETEAVLFRAASVKSAKPTSYHPGESVEIWHQFPIDNDKPVSRGAKGTVLEVSKGWTRYGPDPVIDYLTVQFEDGRVIKDISANYFSFKNVEPRDFTEDTFKGLIKALSKFGGKREKSYDRYGRSWEFPWGKRPSEDDVIEVIKRLPNLVSMDGHKAIVEALKGPPKDPVLFEVYVSSDQGGIARSVGLSPVYKGVKMSTHKPKLPTVPIGHFVVDVSTVPNHDFPSGDQAREVPQKTEFVKVRSMSEAQKVYRSYAQGMGSGNMAGGNVYAHTGKLVAHISYNGRVWEVDAQGNPTKQELKFAAQRVAARFLKTRIEV